MEENQKKSSNVTAFFKQYYLYAVAFLVPLILVITTWILKGIAPFGTNTFLIFEGLNDYIPYFYEFYDKIKEGESLFYSFDGGLGYNFLSLYTYYLSCPLNLIILLFPKAYMITVINFICLFKISLCGVTFTYYLTHRLHGKQADPKDYRTLIFTLGYGLCGGIVAQYYSIQWLDAIYLFPLIMLGFEYLMEKKNTKLFIVTFALSIWCNYYVSFAIFTFLVIYFFLYEWNSFKAALCVGIRFLLSALLALGINAALLLPAFSGMGQTVGGSGTFPTAEFLASYFEVIIQFMSFTTPSYISSVYTTLNGYIGIFALILCILYFLNKNIPVKTRLRKGAFVLIMLLSVNVDFLSYIFMGFQHYEQTPRPYTFLLAFLFLTLGYEIFDEIASYHYVKLLLAYLVPVVLFVCTLQFTNYENTTPYLVTIDALVFYLILVILLKRNSIKKNSFYILMTGLTVIELFGNGYYSFTTLESYTADVSNFSTDTIEKIKSDYHLSDDFSRVEFYNITTQNDGLYTGLPSTVLHSKVMENTAANALSYFNLTKSATSEASTFTTNTTPLITSLLNVKYLLAGKQYILKGTDYVYQGTVDDISVYENPYYLPIGFYVDQDIENWNYQTDSLFEMQNNFVNTAFQTEDIFTDANLNVTIESTVNCTAKEGTSGYICTIPYEVYYSDNADSYVLFSFTPEQDGDLYLYMDTYYHYGEVKAGEEITVPYYLSGENAVEAIHFYGAYFHADAFHAYYEKASAHTLQVTDYSDASITGDITLDEDGYLYTSIPYNENWKVTVDGAEVNYVSLNNQLLGIPLTAGSHTVSITYEADNLYLGIFITVICILCLVYLLADKKVVIQAIEKADNAIMNAKIIDRFTHWCRENYIYLLSFFIPCIIYLVFMMVKNVIPFGYNTMQLNDAFSQLVPFLAEYQRKLQSGESILFDWNGGLGYNYYTFLQIYPNPIYLFLLLLNKSDLILGINILTVFKTAMLGPAFILYMTHRLNGKQANKKDLRLLFFALFYALNGYMLAMHHYIVFYESMFLMPIIILGIEYLIEKKDSRIYILSLGVSIICHYSFSILICVFAVVYFLCYRFKGIKHFFTAGVRFAFSSLFGAGIALITLIPAYLSYKNGAYISDDSTFPKWGFFGSFSDIFSQSFIFQAPTVITSENSEVNLYCGILTLLLVALYFFNRKIKLGQKLRFGFMLVLIFFSFNNEILNYIWHGFHYQSMVPNRFAFIYIFIALIMGYDALVNIKHYKTWHLVCAGLLCGGVFFLAYYTTDVYYGYILPYITSMVLLGIYFFILLWYRRGHFKGKRFLRILTFFLVLEVSANSIVMLINGHVADATSIYSETVALKKIVEKYELDDTLERAELINARSSNESMWVHMKGVTIFHSGFQQDFNNIGEFLGFDTNGNYCKYSDKVSTPFSSSLLGVRYHMYMHEGDKAETSFTYIDTVDNVDIYENETCLPIGFYVPETITDWEASDNPFDSANDFIAATTNTGDIYHTFDINVVSSKEEADEYYSCYSENQYANLYKLHINPEDGDIIYMYGVYIQQLGSIKNADSEDFLQFYYEINNEDETLGAVYDHDAFVEAYNKYMESPLTVTEFTSDSVTGTVDAPNDGYVFLSMVYDDGWNAYVDGEKVETTKLANGLLGIPVSAGEHTIELKFFPQGMVSGIAGTVILTGLYIFLAYRKHKKNKK